jgi:hypothetical protein
MPAPVVTRELSITYAGFVVGGVQGTRLLTDKYRQTRSYTQSNVSFEVVVNADSEANFAAECLAFEAAFRTPRGALTVTQGAVNLIAVTHTGNTGFNAAPSVSKVGGDEDTGRTRRYAVSIDFTEPADLSGQSGRRTSTVEQSYDASRKRTVTITGTYTALGGNSARAQYEASAPTYFAAVLSALTGTFEKTAERADADDANKELTFSVAYDEIIFNQDSGALDNAAIVQPRITVSFSRSSPGDSPAGNVKRLATVTANFESAVDKTVTTDLETLYTGTIKPYLATLASNVANGAAVALVNEDFNLSHASNHISASLTFLAAASMLNLEYELSTEVSEEFGKRIVPTWSGDAYAAHVVPNPATRRRVVMERVVMFGNLAFLDPQGQGTVDIRQLGAQALLAYPPDGGTTGWVTINGSFKQVPRTIGDGTTFDVTAVDSRFEQQWVVAPLTDVSTGNAT